MSLRRRRRLGVLVWGLGALVALSLVGLQGRRVEARGAGFAPPQLVSAVELGRIAEVRVELHEQVGSGAVVVSFERRLLEAEHALAQAELLAMQEVMSADLMTNSRRFAVDQEDVALAQAQTLVTLQEDRARAEALRVQLSIFDDLARAGALASNDRLRLEQELSVVRARVKAGESAIATQRSTASDRAARAGAVASEQPWSVVAAARSVAYAEARLAELDLHAGLDGQVTAIFHRAGETVPAGEPILEITQPETAEVFAWLSAADAGGLTAGQAASVRRESGQTLAGTVVSVGAAPEPLPVYLWVDAQRVEYGVPVRVRLREGAVAPDEPLTVRM